MRQSRIRFRSTLFCALSLAVMAAPAAWSAPKAANLSLESKGAELKFSKEKLTAKAGQPIHLVFKNGAAKDSGLQHNWALVNPGTVDSVGQAGMTAGPDKGYLPDSKDILAHTKLLNPGESEAIDFTAPAKAGDYPYICTFPGHYMMMRGVLHVQ